MVSRDGLLEWYLPAFKKRLMTIAIIIGIAIVVTCVIYVVKKLLERTRRHPQEGS